MSTTTFVMSSRPLLLPASCMASVDDGPRCLAVAQTVIEVDGHYSTACDMHAVGETAVPAPGMSAIGREDPAPRVADRIAAMGAAVRQIIDATRLPTVHVAVRLCCMERHGGAVCRDNRVMCQICWKRKDIDELFVDPVTGDTYDVCKACEPATRPAVR